MEHRTQDLDNVDVGGADDDGGPDGIHPWEIVRPRVPQVHHQVVPPVGHVHPDPLWQMSRS